jgi:Ser/Thr protein kinase RdoA (MazF antagonist)
MDASLPPMRTGRWWEANSCDFTTLVETSRSARVVCAVTELFSHRRSVDADLDQVPAETARLLTDVFAEFVNVPVSLIHGDPNALNIRIDDLDQVWLLDWDESRIDVIWHDLSNLGVPVLAPADHQRAQRLSNAWEALNAWTTEPDYARSRLNQLLD